MTTQTDHDYPFLPVKQWWALRNQFKKTIPGTVTSSYLSTVLSVEEKTARNLLPDLKQMGLINQEGKPTEMAKRWRDDEEYAEVCQEIRSKIYPTELLDALPDPSQNREATFRWFANKTGAGASAANKMVAMYQLLSEAEPSKGSPKAQTTVNGRSRTTQRKTGKAPPNRISTFIRGETGTAMEEQTTENSTGIQKVSDKDGLTLHINIQVHISSDASADQIDQIFASMAKHLYNRN